MKKEIYAFSEKIQGTVSESILWIKIDSNVLGYEFILAAFYLPCEGSIHYSNEVFDNFVHDVIYIKSRFDLPLCLLGDFNARTGTLNDFLESKDKVLNLTGFDFSDDDDDTDILKALQESGITTNRYNNDSHVNNNGKKLIEICQSFDFKIVNGRFGDDKNFGNYTHVSTKMVVAVQLIMLWYLTRSFIICIV